MDPFTPALIDRAQRVLDDAIKTGQWVKGWADAISIMQQHDVCWKQRVPPQFVGICPSNRGKSGVIAADAQKHGSDMLVVGYTETKAQCCYALQSESAQDLAFDNQKVEKSKGILPAVTQLRLVAIAGNHSNCFLRMVSANSKIIIQALRDRCSGSEYLDASRLGATQTDFMRAVKEGIEWNVIHRKAREVWPKLEAFAQRALNIEAVNARSEIEVWKDMLEHAESFPQGEVNWQEVLEQARAGLPQCSDYLSSMVSYLKIFGGTLLGDLDDFLHTLEGAHLANLGGEFIEAVCKLKLPIQQEPLCYTANALLKTNKVGDKVIDNICRYIPVTLPGQLRGPQKIKKTMEVEVAMREAREVVKKLGRDSHEVVEQLGKFDVRCIVWVLGLKPMESTKFDSLDAIREALIYRYIDAMLFFRFYLAHLAP